MAASTLEFVWQDRDIKFDSKNELLACRSNEVIIDSINSVEDTKGNNGERGSLIVTNLRIIWASHTSAKINLSKRILIVVMDYVELFYYSIGTM
jgi:Bardet-Biedl syndrome 5 protein